jgi:hypothetical protein
MQSERPLKDYVGDYDSPNSALTIELEGDHLKGMYNGKPTPLLRVADDVFEATDEAYEGFKITFVPDKNGFPERAIVKQRDLALWEFTREVKRQSVSKKFMRKCAGEYEIADKRVKVAVQPDGKFTITVAGQPNYVLVPGKEDTFDLKNTPGYSIEFREGDQGAVMGAILTQPNGTFVLNKVK